ncbi:hypothetical protein ACJ41O_014445 [Fusarium nematophilum]
MKYLGMILGFALLFATTAQAVTNFANAPQGAHYAKGATEPTCTVTGTPEPTVSCSSTEIQGVGNTNADVRLSVTTTFSGVCHNPGVNSKVVEPFSDSDTDDTSSTLTPTKNGRLLVPSQSVAAPTDEEFLQTFTCPNPNWTPEVTRSELSFIYTVTFAGFNNPVIMVTG